MDSIGELKKRLREAVLNKRNVLDKEEVQDKSCVIIDKLYSLPQFRSAGLIICYIDFKNEVNTTQFINTCLKSGKRVAVPLITEHDGIKTMHACEITNTTDDLHTGYYGILEPVNDRPVPADSIDLAIVPGVAFDKSLNRLGFGKGYYDRFLPHLKKQCLKIGIAFEIQIANFVPVSEYDIKMDMIITEERIITRFDI